jgi:lipoprotein-anchoring transpeptidase ErfK/SrfK
MPSQPADSAANAAATTPVPTAAESPTLPPPPQLERNFSPREPRDVFEAQIALMRDSICPGSIDGVMGTQTRNALYAFQTKYGVRVTGILDHDTRAMLQLLEPPLTTYTVTPADLARLRPWPEGWEPKSQLDRLDYSTVLELVAEKSWSNPKVIVRLNPQITNWDEIAPGTVLAVPRVYRRQPSTRPMRIVISLSQKTLQLFDAESRLLAHFPCSIARRVEKRPVGRIEVVTTAPNPNYTFNPANFPDSEEAQRIGRKLILQPGPNNPVGVAWIGLNLPGYGIHGSPEPEKIGRTESAGCFRLSNWNAEYLLPLAYPGLAIDVEP